MLQLLLLSIPLGNNFLTRYMNRFELAYEKVEEIHLLDPKMETEQGEQFPAEYLYSVRMGGVLQQYMPEASEILKLAAICQHFRRWEIPRSNYPMTREGYHSWRTKLFDYQGQKAAELLATLDYTEEECGQIKRLIAKKSLKSDPQAQALEDIVCLVFFKYYAEEFSAKHDEEKLAGIVKKTLAKMSAPARGMLEIIGIKDELKSYLKSFL